MTWTDEELMAHADGEGDERQRALLETALSGDAVLRARCEALVTQRKRFAAAFAGVLDEAVPERLTALLAPPPATASTAATPPSPTDTAATRPTADVLDLTRARARRDERRTMGWQQWGGMAASLALGLALGWQMAPQRGDILVDAQGRIVAGDRLALALSSRLASEPSPDGGVQIQISFLDRDGRYCRTFSAAHVAGLACSDGAQWTVQTTTVSEPAQPGAGLRQAATPLPQAVLDAVDARISGEALSAVQERAARERGWTGGGSGAAAPQRPTR